MSSRPSVVPVGVKQVRFSTATQEVSDEASAGPWAQDPTLSGRPSADVKYEPPLDDPLTLFLESSKPQPMKWCIFSVSPMVTRRLGNVPMVTRRLGNVAVKARPLANVRRTQTRCLRTVALKGDTERVVAGKAADGTTVVVRAAYIERQLQNNGTHRLQASRVMTVAHREVWHRYRPRTGALRASPSVA